MKDDDLHRDQRLTEVKCSKLLHGDQTCQISDNFDDNIFIGVKSQQRSNVVNYVLWLFGQKYRL